MNGRQPDLLMERGLPESVETERLVLGSILLDYRENLPAALGLLRPQDFALKSHRRIFGAMVEMDKVCEPVDRVTVFNRLQANGHAEAVGGLSYLVSLDDGLPRLCNFEQYLLIVREKAILRRTVFACDRLKNACLLGIDPPADLLAQAERTLVAIAGDAATGGRLRTASEVFAEQGVEAILNQSRAAGKSIPFPWPSLNELLIGVQSGQLVVIAARPGVGKSAAAAQLAAHAAMEGSRVALFSLEMSASEILQRMVCSAAGVNMHTARRGRLSEQERFEMSRAATDIAALPLYIDDATGCTMGALNAAVRRLNAKHPVGLVIVDYLQLMDVPGRRENRNVEISEISRGLKRLARELEFPVVALSQLNREPEKHMRRPMLADLRDSGSIEQDADVVVLLHLVNAEPGARVVDCEFLVAKHRNGPIGKRVLRFHRESTRFVDREGS